MKKRIAEVLIVLLACAGMASAGSSLVRLGLLVRPELDLKGTEKVFLGPFVLEPRDRGARGVNLATLRQFERFVHKLLRRETRLTLLPTERLRPPTDDLTQLVGDREYWLEIAGRTDADYIVAASVDVETLDQEGYTTEEYVSPSDGKTYFRQVLVEETGFSFDILLLVISGETGELVHEEQISAFKPKPESQLNVYEDLFNEIYLLENRLAGVFVPRRVIAKRYLYKDAD